MKIKRQDSDDYTVLRIEGELGIDTAPELSQEVNKLIRENRMTVIIDLGTCFFVDASAIGYLIAIYKKLEGANRQLVLVIPSPETLKILKITKVADLFTIEKTLEDALAKL